MPKLIIYHPDTVSLDGVLMMLLRELVADAVSTPQSPLKISHVDWVPIKYGGEGDLTTFAQPIAIEIETLGFPYRKQKLTEEYMTKIKDKIVELLEDAHIRVDRDKPLIWLRFQDPDGCHI